MVATEPCVLELVAPLCLELGARALELFEQTQLVVGQSMEHICARRLQRCWRCAIATVDRLIEVAATAAMRTRAIASRICHALRCGTREAPAKEQHVCEADMTSRSYACAT